MGENNKRKLGVTEMSKRIIAIFLAYITMLALYGENNLMVFAFYLAFIQIFNKTMVFNNEL